MEIEIKSNICGPAITVNVVGSDVTIRRAYNAVIFETEGGKQFGVAMRDDGIEVVSEGKFLLTSNGSPPLEGELARILSHYCGERGNSEGAADTLRRIICERDTARAVDTGGVVYY